MLEELWILNLFVCCRNVCFIVDEDDAVVRIEVPCVLSVSRYLRIVVDDVEASRSLLHRRVSGWVSSQVVLCCCFLQFLVTEFFILLLLNGSNSSVSRFGNLASEVVEKASAWICIISLTPKQESSQEALA